MTIRRLAILALACLPAYSTVAAPGESGAGPAELNADDEGRADSSRPSPVAQRKTVYKWIDAEGNVYFSDTPPDAEQLTEEEKEREIAVARKLQERADLALLGTCPSGQAIGAFTRYRVELLRAARERVAEQYLKNLQRRLASLEAAAIGPENDEALLREMRDTRETVREYREVLERNEECLERVPGEFEYFQDNPEHYRNGDEEIRVSRLE